MELSGKFKQVYDMEDKALNVLAAAAGVSRSWALKSQCLANTKLVHYNFLLHVKH